MVGKDTWQLQEAKARLSELIRRAQQAGPQTITVHGAPAVVVLDQADYERLIEPRPHSLLEILQSSPLKEFLTDEEIDELFARDPNDYGQTVELED
jgi:prevent-host-death family protein